MIVTSALGCLALKRATALSISLSNVSSKPLYVGAIGGDMSRPKTAESGLSE